VIYHVIVTPTAEAEALEAFRWYAARSRTAGERWYAGPQRALDGLAKNPGRCPVSEEDSEALGREVRLLLYGRRRGVYRILYAISGDIVRVLRIRHSARGPIEPEV
jgi:plasmid stabilization system protein ParE